MTYRRHRCGVFVGDENVRQVEDAAHHDEADAVRGGSGHGEEIPKAIPLQQFSLLQHLFLQYITYIHEAVFPQSEISRFRPDFGDIFTSVMRGCVSHLCLYFVSAPATDGLAEATDAPGVVRVSRGWRREQVGRTQCTCRSRSGCCSSRGVSNVFMYGDETGLTRVWRQRGCPRNE